MGERVAQVLFELAALFSVGMEIGVVEVVTTAPAVLGCIERKIGIADDGFAGHAIFG